jgi:cytochrome c peroxidase
VAHLNFFDIPTLYGISKTAPYFHDNSGATLEDVVILDVEIAPLVAYLKKI